MGEKMGNVNNAKFADMVTVIQALEAEVKYLGFELDHAAGVLEYWEEHGIPEKTPAEDDPGAIDARDQAARQRAARVEGLASTLPVQDRGKVWIIQNGKDVVTHPNGWVNVSFPRQQGMKLVELASTLRERGITTAHLALGEGVILLQFKR